MPAVIDFDDELLAEACGVTVEQLAMLPDYVVAFALALLAYS
jgi:hypothetical protein